MRGQLQAWGWMMFGGVPAMMDTCGKWCCRGCQLPGPIENNLAGYVP